MTRPSRRDFLKGTVCASAFVGCGGAAGLFQRTALAAGAQPEGRGTALVVIQLSGGNDGLNTVVPYEDDAYHRSRPTLRLAADRVHKLEAGLGLHPDMPAFARLYHEGRLSIVQGVGYPNSKRDHPVAMRDWETAMPQQALAQTGWGGRVADFAHASPITDVPSVFVGPIAPPFGVRAGEAVVPAIRSLEEWLPSPRMWLTAQGTQAPGTGQPSPTPSPMLDFLRESTARAYAARDRIQSSRRAQSSDYPRYPLAQSLKSVAQLIRAELGIRFYLTELGGGDIGGFDSHAGQVLNHGSLLKELSESVAAFAADLQRDRLFDSVLVMTFSEFGRSLSENGRRGTDHGAAAPVFLAGGRLKGGLVGKHPSLTDLDQDAPKFHTDFRRLYATALDGWLGIDSGQILRGTFAPVEGVKFG